MPTSAAGTLRRARRLRELAFALDRAHSERRKLLLQFDAIARGTMRFLRAMNDGFKLFVAILADVFEDGHGIRYPQAIIKHECRQLQCGIKARTGIR